MCQSHWTYCKSSLLPCSLVIMSSKFCDQVLIIPCYSIKPCPPSLFGIMGPLQLGSRDHNFPKNLLYYGLQLKKCQKWKEHIENTSNYFHTNLLIFFEIQTIIKSHSLMLGTSNFAIFGIFDMLFPFLAFLKL